MLSREDLTGFADAPVLLAPPRFPRTDDQSSALNATLRAIDTTRREGEDRDAELDAGASLTDQLAAAEARHAALTPAIDDAMAPQEALAAAGLGLSVQDAEGQRRLVVSRRRSTAPQVAFEREPAE